MALAATVLERLALTAFRSYAALTWTPASGLVLIGGANGAGKTNLLEAISLLVPGRGLRGARVAELPRVEGGVPATRWGVAARLVGPDGGFALGTGAHPNGAPDRRAFRLDGAAPRSQAEIASRVSATWLTPQMDRLFQEGAGGRRRFLDRLVQALDPGHAGRVAAHDAAVTQRNRLLAEGAEAGWLSALEETLARQAVSVTAGRVALLRRLNAALAPAASAWLEGFPSARLDLVCAIAARLAEAPALDVEDRLRRALAGSREADRRSGASSVGAHRADVAIAGADGVAAAQASTGEQKAILLALVLAHAGLLQAARGAAPLLLLDEPLVHLDPTRRGALLRVLRALPGQVFATGAEWQPFEALGDAAERWTASGGTLRPGVAP